MRTLIKLSTIALFVFLIAIIGSCVSSEIRTQEPEPGTQDSVIVWPPPPLTPKIKYLRSITGSADLGLRQSWFKKAIDTIFGKEGKEGVMLRPYGVFADSGRIYVTDPGAYLLHVFDTEEKKYFQIKKAGKEELISPIGVAVDKNGEIYLSDSMLKRVFVFDREGKYIRQIGSPDIFSRPAGIAIDNERIYVVDTHGHSVFVFSKKDGSFLFSFGKNGSEQGDFNYPTNIFIGNDKHLYITDSMNFRVQIFDRDGNFLSAFGKLGDSSGNFSKPKGIAVDSEGHIYVADAHFDTVQIFDKTGRLLLSFGTTGRGKGEMILPAGVFIDGKDRIYVADSYNNRIQIFQYLKDKDSGLRPMGAKD
jgi:DNA-binding beta-propeller fold protein YncE